MSASVGASTGIAAASQLDPGPHPGGLRPRVDVMRGGDVFDGEAQRLEDRDLLRGAPPVHAAEEDVPQLTLHVIVADGPFRARDEEVAGLVRGRLAAVHEDTRP